MNTLRTDSCVCHVTSSSVAERPLMDPNCVLSILSLTALTIIISLPSGSLMVLLIAGVNGIGPRPCSVDFCGFYFGV